MARRPADEWVRTGIVIIRSSVHRTTWHASFDGDMAVELFGQIIAGPLHIVKKAAAALVAEDAHEVKWERTMTEVWEMWIVPFTE